MIIMIASTLESDFAKSMVWPPDNAPHPHIVHHYHHHPDHLGPPYEHIGPPHLMIILDLLMIILDLLVIILDILMIITLIT